MYSRLTFKGTHAEWKEKFDQLSQKMGMDGEKTEIVLGDIIVEDLADELQYDYHYHPSRLLHSLVEDTKSLISFYNDKLLMDQSDLVRLFMTKLSRKLEDVQRSQKVNFDSQKLRDQKLQYEYDSLCAELTQYATQLEGEDDFYPKLEKIYKRFAMNVNTQTKPPAKQELQDLRKAEKTAYQVELDQLNRTISALPETAIKKDSIDLVKKIESNRLASQQISIFSPNKPFDYRRQTLNLKKTNALLSNRDNTELQDDYRKLIEQNVHHTDILNAMRKIFMGLVIEVIFGICVVIEPPTIVITATPMAMALGWIGWGVGQLTNSAHNTTGAKMSKLFNTIQQPPEEPLAPTSASSSTAYMRV